MRTPIIDGFGVRGRIWLFDQGRLLPVDEQQTVVACLRQIDFLEREIELVVVEIAKQVLASEDIRWLRTLPGVSGVTATGMLASIGDVSRFLVEAFRSWPDLLTVLGSARPLLQTRLGEERPANQFNAVTPNGSTAIGSRVCAPT